MRSVISRMALVASAALALMLVTAGPASAHQHRHVNGFDTTVGWGNEPTFAGFTNAVQFIIERPAQRAGDHAHGEGADEHAQGRPVTNAKLQVEVLFGGADSTEKTDPLPLEPAFGAPGEYRAPIIPTDPGTYTFHIYGTVGTTEFDEYYTSGDEGKNAESEGTYNDVRAPKEISFPNEAPTTLDVELVANQAESAASGADSSANTALYVAIAAALLGMVSLILSLRKAKTGV